MAMSSWPHFFAHPVELANYNTVLCKYPAYLLACGYVSISVEFRPSKSVFISQYWEMTEHQAKFHKHLYDHETITFLNWRSFYHTNNRQSSQYIALTTVTQKTSDI